MDSVTVFLLSIAGIFLIGALGEIIDALVTEHQAALLADESA